MAETISYAFVDQIYADWVAYMQDNSDAKYFGYTADWTRIAKFPFGNFQLIGKSPGESNLENDEVTARVVFQTTVFINGERISTLYDMDAAASQFFQDIGFHRMGDSALIRVADSVNAMASRFVCDNFNGEYAASE